MIRTKSDISWNEARSSKNLHNHEFRKCISKNYFRPKSSWTDSEVQAKDTTAFRSLERRFGVELKTSSTLRTKHFAFSTKTKSCFFNSGCFSPKAFTVERNSDRKGAKPPGNSFRSLSRLPGWVPAPFVCTSESVQPLWGRK